jgi:hypothetical protein
MTIVTKAGLAAELGISKPRVSQYCARGMPIRSDDKIDREAAIKWIAENHVSLNDQAGAGLARKLAKRGTTKEPLEAWLRPVNQTANPFDQGCLFATLWAARNVSMIAGLAAHESGAPIEIAKRTEEVAAALFASVAADVLRTNKIGPFKDSDDPPIWSADFTRVDWETIAKQQDFGLQCHKIGEGRAGADARD